MLRPEARNSFAFVYAICVILSLCVYSRAFDKQFCRDDLIFLDHAEKTSFRDLLKPSPDIPFYRPGARALFSLEHKLFAHNSRAYTTFNYALHVAISILMLLILLQVDANRNMAFLAGGLFLVGFGHYGKEVMSACLSGPLASVLLSLTAILITLKWLKSRTHDYVTHKKPRYVFYPAIVFILLTMSPLFHEASSLTPAVVAFIVAISLPSGYRSRLKHVVFFLLPLPLSLLLFSVVSKWYPAYRHIAEAIPNVPLYLIRYLGFMVFPVQGTRIIGPSPIVDLAIKISYHVHIIIGLALVVFLLYLALRSSTRLRILSAWLLLVLVPAASVPMPGLWLELRYVYYAAIPFCGLTAIAVLELLSRPRVCWKVIAYGVVLGGTAGSLLLTLLLEKN